MIITFDSATSAWDAVLRRILQYGTVVEPRGIPTLELLNNALAFPASVPVVMCPARKLSKKFLSAEAFWILSGDDRVDTIAPFNKRIADFSDDGVRFFGAYGPKFQSQVGYVTQALVRDRDTRQAVINIWRETPPPTKDVPCTLSVGFSIRKDRLNAHITMRSSDAWLGFPYDVFNFSMMALYVAIRVNLRGGSMGGPGFRPVRLGDVYWTAASSHLYERDLEGARTCLAELRGRTRARDHAVSVPTSFPVTANTVDLMAILEDARDANTWPVFAPVKEKA